MIESNENEEVPIEEFQWANRLQHILYAIAYMSDFSGMFFIFAESKSENYSYTLQFLVLSIVIGYPLVLYQTTAGQFTRNGCIVAGEMLPVLYGLGYSMIALEILDITAQYLFFRGIFHYLLSSLFNFELPWMQCFTGYFQEYPNCLSVRDLEKCLFRRDKTKPCVPIGSKILSAEIYREIVIFREAKEIPVWFISKEFLMRSYVLMGVVVAVLITAAMNKNYKSLYPALRIGYSFSFLFMISCSVLMVAQEGFLLGLQYLGRQFILNGIFNPKSWLIMVRKVVFSLKVANGGFFTFGAFIPKTQPDKYRTGILVFAYVVIFYGYLIYFHITCGFLISVLGMKINSIMSEDDIDYIFVLFPTIYGLVSSPNIFSFLYFLVFFIVCYFGIVVKIMVVESTISLYFHISAYASYIRFTVCMVTTTLIFCLEWCDSGMHFYKVRFLREIYSVSLVILQMAVLLFYGMGNFGDDIEFITMFKLKTIIKVSWSFVLFLCVIDFAAEAKLTDFRTDFHINIACATIITSALFSGFFYQLAHAMKKKNLIGLLKASERYGPPQLDEKIQRILYNPRLTVKWKRREEVCAHDCLLGCNAINVAIQHEIKLLQGAVDSLSTSSGHHEKSRLKTYEKLIEILMKLHNSEEHTPV